MLAFGEFVTGLGAKGIEASSVKTRAPITYQLETYNDSRPRAKKPGRNWTMARVSARTMSPSTTSGNSAHSSGWLMPARTRTQPGTMIAKFHRPNIHSPSMLKNRWNASPCRKPYVTTCHGRKP